MSVTLKVQPLSALRCAGLSFTAFVASVLAAPILASDEDFALAFAIEALPGEALFAIDLPPEVYATLTTPDLRDLVVVDAQGREQPISLHRPPPPLPPPMPLVLPLPLPIAVPAEATTTPGLLELHLRRDADGRLGALDLRSVDALPNASDAREWLLDVGDTARDGLDGLRFATKSTDDFRSLLEVRGSNDLVTWEILRDGSPLLRASDAGQVIERLELRFPHSTHRYLALRPLPSAGPLPAIDSVSGLRLQASEPVPLSTLVLTSTGPSTDGKGYDFASPGPLNVRQIEVQLANTEGFSGFQLDQRLGDYWQPLATGTAWQLQLGGEILRAPPVDTSLVGIGPLRVRLTPAADPPRLVLGYYADRVVVLATATGPYRLLAGSVHRRHAPVPMDAALAAIRAQRGEHWQPALARLGPATRLGGEAALVPKADPGRIALWLVLGLGVLVVGLMAWRLLRVLPQDTKM